MQGSAFWIKMEYQQHCLFNNNFQYDIPLRNQDNMHFLFTCVKYKQHEPDYITEN